MLFLFLTLEFWLLFLFFDPILTLRYAPSLVCAFIGTACTRQLIAKSKTGKENSLFLSAYFSGILIFLVSPIFHAFFPAAIPGISAVKIYLFGAGFLALFLEFNPPYHPCDYRPALILTLILKAIFIAALFRFGLKGLAAASALSFMILAVYTAGHSFNFYEWISLFFRFCLVFWAILGIDYGVDIGRPVLTFLIKLALLSLLISPFLLSVHFKRPKKPAPLERKILYGLAGFILIFALLEIGANWYMLHRASDEFLTQYGSLAQIQKVYQSAMVSHRYLGYAGTPNFQKQSNRHNSLGFRGDEIPIPKPPGEFRIACIGGSTTYEGAVQDYKLAYPQLLEARLKEKGYSNVRVINAGLSGWASWESLINFEFRLLDLDVDLVIIYDALNDAQARLVWPPDAYRGDNSGAKEPPATKFFLQNPLEYSTVLRYFLVRFKLTKPQSVLEVTLDKKTPTFYGSMFEDQVFRGIYPSGIFKTVPVAEMLRKNPPVYFQRNLENLIAIAKKRNIKVVLATFAYVILPNQTTSVPEYRAALEEMNGILRKMAADEKVYLFDFSKVSPKDPKLYHDGTHVNPDGSKIKASLFADYLVQNELIPRN